MEGWGMGWEAEVLCTICGCVYKYHIFAAPPPPHVHTGTPAPSTAPFPLPLQSPETERAGGYQFTVTQMSNSFALVERMSLRPSSDDMR